jgi:hypothetical protein
MTSPEGVTKVNDLPLIFFHFHQFQLIEDGTFYRLSPYYTVEATPPEKIYEAYESAMCAAIEIIQMVCPGFSSGIKTRAQVYSRKWVQTFVPRPIKELLKKFIKY